MEKLYQYLWKTRMLGRSIKDVDGKLIEIIDPGQLNSDAGPDFFNAKLKIDDVEWAGNVEIHVHASDWYRHNHDSDPAYENVILHVVAHSDKRILKKDGSKLPQAELTFGEKFFRTVADLNDESLDIRCATNIRRIDRLNLTDCLETLHIERLQQKAQRILSTLQTVNGDWQQTCFITLARGLGFGLNGDPFEMLAKSLPLNIIHHHSDDPFQIEALFFGQAAMLDPTRNLFDDYYQRMCSEFYFLARKYNLRPMRPGLWKYSRTRPGNFPHRRIACLAAEMIGGFSLFNRILETKREPERLEALFNLKTSGYWTNHFSFDADASGTQPEISAGSRMLLVINVAIPLLYAYAAYTGNIELAEQSSALLYEIPAENNSIIRQWRGLGLKVDDAARSQALIHLRKEYCDQRKCMYCRLGFNLMKNAIE